MIYVHMSYAVPSYHFIILVSITPVRAKITGYKLKTEITVAQAEITETGRDYSGRDYSGRDYSGRDYSGRDYSGRDHSGRGREWPRSPCSHWRLDGTGEYQILAQDKVNVNRPALPSSTTAHTHYGKCHYDYLVIY